MTHALRDLLDIARDAAVRTGEWHDYLPQDPDDARYWQPHTWVLEAMAAAVRADRVRRIDSIRDCL